MNLSTYIDNATFSELIIAFSLICAGLFTLYILFKVIKYVVIITMIIAGLFFFDVLNKEMFANINSEYKVTESVDKFLNKHTGKNKGLHDTLKKIKIKIK
jgi:hypothetical protein